MTTGEKSALTYRTRQVAQMLGVNESTVRTYVRELGLSVASRPAGSVQIRQFTIDDIFRISAHKNPRDPDRAQKIVSCYLPKGGVSKSTLATELAVMLQLAGVKTILIDLDPQASASYIFGLDPEINEDDYAEMGYRAEDVVSATFYNIFDFKAGNIKHLPLTEIVKKTYGLHGPTLIPADITLTHLSHLLSRDSYHPLTQFLRMFEKARQGKISQVSFDEYDLVLFDCPPASSLITSNALVASDYCIAPVRLDALAAKSLGFLSTDLQELAKEQLPYPELITIPTFFSQSTSRSIQILTSLTKHYSSSLLGPMLPQSEVFPRGLLTVEPQERMPVSLRNPMHRIVKEDLRQITDSLIRRLWPK